MTQFTVAGVDYRFLPLAALDRLAANPRTDETLVAGLDDAVALVTCNRIEVLTGQQVGVQALVQRVLDACELTMDNPSTVQVRSGDDALRHLCRIASGLDALVIGEQIVTNQIKLALDSGRERGAQRTVGLLERVLTVARQARDAAQFDRIRREIGTDAGNWLARHLEHPDRSTVVILGASGAAAEAGIALRRSGVGRIILANRQPEKAAALAEQIGAANRSLDDLPRLLKNADAVIGASRSTNPPLSRKTVTTPMLIVDIAEPSDVAPGLFGEHGLKIVTAFDVSPKAKEAVHRAETAIEFALPALIRWAAGLGDSPLRRFRQWSDEVVETELQAFFRKYPDLTDDREAIERLVNQIRQKLLHGQGVQLGKAEPDVAEKLLLEWIGGSRRNRSTKERHNRRNDEHHSEDGKLGSGQE